MRSRRLGNGVGFFPVALLFFDNRLQTEFGVKKPSSSQLTGSSSLPRRISVTMNRFKKVWELTFLLFLSFSLLCGTVGEAHLERDMTR